MESKNGTCEDLNGVLPAGQSEPIQLMAITYKPSYLSYIKKSKTDTKFLLDNFYNYIISKKYNLVAHCIEYDTKGIPHIHGTIQVPISKLYQDFKVNGWHIYIIKIKNIDKWTDYCNKDQESDGYMFL